MDLMQIGVQLFKSQLDKNGNGQLEMTEIASALMGLMGSGQNQAQAGGLGGLASMISGMQGNQQSGLSSLVNSWIGTGQNIQPSGSQLTQMFGQDKIAAFAQQLGISQEQALQGLQAAVPEVVDKASPNGSLDMGSLLNSVGGVSGAIGLASKLFGR
ncbi:YidB family protein [Thiothrix winogradskyi]|uniref:YidB family protein n=1 Tax=Thiothrix winogradskyi TaxID=96472 RepID=A0ABY3SZD4_9GAMM|nr:YidB family protein [Thiothrix winogradskyi]UJS23820.1 YidB family protein [Thiothrix winogradskyi]